MSAWGMSVGRVAGVGWEGAAQDVNSIKIVRRVEVHKGFILAPFETTDAQTSKVSMSTNFYAIKEYIQRVCQHFLWRAIQAGAMNNRGHGTDE